MRLVIVCSGGLSDRDALMKKEVADEWIKALRSGDYNQTKESLSDGDGFCCLGVLCDISGLGSWNDYGDSTHYGTEGEVLPEFVMEWAGIRDPEGKWENFDNPKAITLTCLNDGHRVKGNW